MTFAKQLKWNMRRILKGIWWALAIIVLLAGAAAITNIFINSISKAVIAKGTVAFFLYFWFLSITLIIAACCLVYIMLYIFNGLRADASTLENSTSCPFWKSLTAKWLAVFIFNAFFTFAIKMQSAFLYNYTSNVVFTNGQPFLAYGYGFGSVGTIGAPSSTLSALTEFTNPPLIALLLGLGYIIAGSFGKKRGARIFKAVIFLIAAMFVRNLFALDSMLSIFGGISSGMPAGTGIVGGADGPTAIFVSTKIVPQVYSIISALGDLAFSALAIFFSHRLFTRRYDMV